MVMGSCWLSRRLHTPGNALTHSESAQHVADERSGIKKTRMPISASLFLWFGEGWSVYDAIAGAITALTSAVCALAVNTP